MSTKSTTLIAGLMAAFLGFTAADAAQAQNFGVEANAVTGGYTGTYADYSGWRSREFSVNAVSDPAGREFNNGYGMVFADAGASSNVTPGELYASASAVATRYSATAFRSNVQGDTLGRYSDSFTVVSDTLPVNTPVTLVFRHAVNVTWNVSGLYNGSVTATVQIGGASNTAKWSAVWNQGEPAPVSSGTLTVNTRVGARLSVSGKLNTRATAYYFAPGPLYSGSLSLEASSLLMLESASDDAGIRADSGAEYRMPV